MRPPLQKVMRYATIADDRGWRCAFGLCSFVLRLLDIQPNRTAAGYLIGWKRNEEHWTSYGTRREP